MIPESRLRPVKLGVIALALELAIAAVGGYRSKEWMGRSSRERYGRQRLKLVVFQEQAVGRFGTQCRRRRIRGIAFVACTFEKPRTQTLY